MSYVHTVFSAVMVPAMPLMNDASSAVRPTPTMPVGKYSAMWNGEIAGGMKKRAGFARALVMRPEIIMCDEPDSGLDPVRTKLLCNLIKQLHAEHGGTYVVITHNIDAARTLSDNVGVLWKGGLVHFGPADEAFNSQEPFVQQFLHGSDVGPLGME